jgi:hypothetical protein
MKLHRLIASMAALVLGAFLAPTADADTLNTFSVRLFLVNTDGTQTELTTNPPLQLTTSAVNLDADLPAGGARRYFANGAEVFQISKCQGCAGRARVFVSTGSINRLVLTDAQITNTQNPAATLTLRVVASSGDLPISGPGGQYPYAAELSGTFTAPLGQAATDPANRITVNATTQGDCDGPCRIDNPFFDPGEGENGNSYSLVAPPFLAGGLAQYAPKEQDIIGCNNVQACVPDPNGDGCIGYTYSCQPSLGLSIDISLKSRNGARIPGSIGTFHVPERCEPDNGLLAGCETMADFFASIGPKGFKVYAVRLEPSPGAQSNVEFRDGTRNSDVAWATKRGDDDEDDHGNNGIVSNTVARLSTNGSGELKANGLCPAAGCSTLPTSPTLLPVRVYCGASIISTTAISLNNKGDGKANVSFSVPCSDPAVLIMDVNDDRWVAAPAIF